MSPSSTGDKMGLLSVFGSTLFQLSGVFMLSPLMLLMFKKKPDTDSASRR